MVLQQLLLRISATTADNSDLFGTGPSHSFFATPWYGFIDSVRVIDLITVGLFVGRVIVGLAKGWMPKYWRRMSWIGIAALMVYMAMTEISKIGYPVGAWGRLWVGTAGVFVVTYSGTKFVNPSQARVKAFDLEPHTWREAWAKEIAWWNRLDERLIRAFPYRPYEEAHLSMQEGRAATSAVGDERQQQQRRQQIQDQSG